MGYVYTVGEAKVGYVCTVGSAKVEYICIEGTAKVGYVHTVGEARWDISVLKEQQWWDMSSKGVIYIYICECLDNTHYQTVIHYRSWVIVFRKQSTMPVNVFTTINI